MRGAQDSANAPDGPPEPEQGEEAAPPEAPEDETLRITIPKMARIEDDTIPTTAGDDEAALKEHAAIHLEGTVAAERFLAFRVGCGEALRSVRYSPWMLAVSRKGLAGEREN